MGFVAVSIRARQQPLPDPPRRRAGRGKVVAPSPARPGPSGSAPSSPPPSAPSSPSSNCPSPRASGSSPQEPQAPDQDERSRLDTRHLRVPSPISAGHRPDSRTMRDPSCGTRVSGMVPEVCFRQTRQDAGVGQARNRVRRAVERTVPFGLVCYSLAIVWYSQHGQPAPRPGRPPHPGALVSHQGHPIGGRHARSAASGPHRHAISPGSDHRADPARNPPGAGSLGRRRSLKCESPACSASSVPRRSIGPGCGVSMVGVDGLLVGDESSGHVVLVFEMAEANIDP
jgi:hypothetical protein